MRGALPGMAFKQLRHRVQQEREEQAIRLGEIEPSLERASGSLPLTERVPGARLQQERRDQPHLMGSRSRAVEDGRERGGRRSRVLAVACLITYWLVTSLLPRVYSASRDDDLLGGMWAVIAAVSRMAATSVSFVLCLIYLAFLPFHAWALAVLVGASALAVMLLGRPGDAVTAGITTAVIMVVAAVSPQHAWQQPILRLVDTVVGVAVGVMAAWAGIQVKRLLPARPVPPAPPKAKIDLPERAMVRGPRIRL